MNEYPKIEELHQSEKISIFWQIQIAISLDWKKINTFCLFYSIMHSLGLQDIIMDNVVSKNHFLRNVLMRARCAQAKGGRRGGGLVVISKFKFQMTTI